MHIVSKIAVAQVIGKVPTQIVDVTVIGEDGKAAIEKQKRGIDQALMRVTGLATGFKTGNSTYGEWIAFTGQFEAINILSGEVYRAGKIHFPSMINDLLRGAVESAGDSGVEFAFDIGVKGAGNAHGYEYTLTNLIPVAANDPLKALSARLLAEAPALPAPKIAPKQAALAAPTEPAVEATAETKPAAKAKK